jgi:hypothetical protein
MYKKISPALKILGLGRGFKSHPVHFFLLYKYGIGLSLSSVIVGQNDLDSDICSDN